jgi:lipoyl(octanoyl) transferase
VEAWRVPGRTGVWTEEGKLASIGVGVRRWVTMHGFALNVSADLAEFDRINPCGIEGCPVTSLERERGIAIPMAEIKGKVAEKFERLLEEWLPLKPV